MTMADLLTSEAALPGDRLTVVKTTGMGGEDLVIAVAAHQQAQAYRQGHGRSNTARPCHVKWHQPPAESSRRTEHTVVRDDRQPCEGVSHDRAVAPTLAECFTQGWAEAAPAVPVLSGVAYA